VAGIGENGHLAFIDPPVCDFNDPRDVRVVDLDEACRMQQVHDGAFARLEDVPRRALSLTIPVLMGTPRMVVLVPGTAKRRAVLAAVEGPIQEACPASILRRHPCAPLFLDSDSAPLLAAFRGLTRFQTGTLRAAGQDAGRRPDRRSATRAAACASSFLI